MYTYDELKQFVDHCTRCPLSQTRNKAVMGNRDPKPEEQEMCISYLKYETLLLRPKIIVCLGRIAAQRIIRPDYRITREHGTFLVRKNWMI